jgi:hypothetical protein
MEECLKMKRVLSIFFLVLNLAVWFVQSSAEAYVGLCCAHCGGNMPMNIPGGGIPETHEFRVKVGQNFMRMGPFRSGTTDVSTTSLLGVPTQDGKFVVAPSEMRMWMTMASVAYSFTDRFALMAMTGYRYNEMDMEFNALANAATGSNGFTMKSDGMSDFKVMGKYRLFADDDLAPTNQLSAIVGLSFPTGEVDSRFRNNPIPGVNDTLQPFRMQQGSGTYDPILGLTFQTAKDPYWFGLNAIYTGRWMDNEQGYHQGQEVKVDTYAMYQFHPKALFEVQLNFHHEGQYSNEPDAQRFEGAGHVGFNPASPFTSPLFNPDFYGGTKLNITGGFQYQPFDLQIVELLVSTPIVQNLHGPQLSEDWRIMFNYYIEIPTKKSRRYVGTKAPKELGF